MKVLDFGLVKHLAKADMTTADVLTRTDVVAGTPHFMAPEMALDPFNVDGRGDLYALGCVAFWLLTGRVVFEEDTPIATILAHAQREPAPPSSTSPREIPEPLEQIVLECLAKDPAARPQNAEALSARLADVPFEHPWSEEDAALWWKAYARELQRFAAAP